MALGAHPQFWVDQKRRSARRAKTEGTAPSFRLTSCRGSPLSWVRYPSSWSLFLTVTANPKFNLLPLSLQCRANSTKNAQVLDHTQTVLKSFFHSHCTMPKCTQVSASSVQSHISIRELLPHVAIVLNFF